jgi:phage terminase large subunit GpA-like protein
VNGQIIKAWEIPEGEDRRNETFDCAVYASAAIFRLRPNWQALKKNLAAAPKLELVRAEPPSPIVTEDKPKQPEPLPMVRRKQPIRARSSFVTRW